MIHSLYLGKNEKKIEQKQIYLFNFCEHLFKVDQKLL